MNLTSTYSQTCWAVTSNNCAADGGEVACGEPYIATDTSIVVDYSCTDKYVKVHISQWQTLFDTIPPIFDFCYPTFGNFEQFVTYLEDEIVPIEAVAKQLTIWYPFLYDFLTGSPIDSTLFFGVSIESILDSIREGSLHPVAAFQCR